MLEAEETTKAASFCPVLGEPQVAKVILSGPALMRQMEAGRDRVLISKYAGTEVKIDGEEYNIVKQGDILAIVE